MPANPEKQAVTARSTEGSRPGANRGKGPQTAAARRGPGRPKGSKNKTKSLIPAELATDILGVMKERLPAEHYEYMRGVIQRGEAISTVKELDVLITLVRASVMPYLALEAIPLPVIEDGEVAFDDEGNERRRLPGINRDATDRLKLLNSLLSLKDSVERREKEKDDEDGQPLIVKVFNARGILSDGGRLAFLAGGSGSVAGDADGTGRPALPPRTVSGPVVERPEPESDLQ